MCVCMSVCMCVCVCVCVLGGGGGKKCESLILNYHKSALSRQIKEAVRIRRRGGERRILNSKVEFNRC